jgi:hypothetical protein
MMRKLTKATKTLVMSRFRVFNDGAHSTYIVYSLLNKHYCEIHPNRKKERGRLIVVDSASG